MTAWDYNPNVGQFIVTGQICEGDISTCNNEDGSKTLISSDYGQTFVEKANWPTDAYRHACAVFLDDTQVRKRRMILKSMKTHSLLFVLDNHPLGFCAYRWQPSLGMVVYTSLIGASPLKKSNANTYISARVYGLYSLVCRDQPRRPPRLIPLHSVVYPHTSLASRKYCYNSFNFHIDNRNNICKRNQDFVDKKRAKYCELYT